MCVCVCVWTRRAVQGILPYYYLARAPPALRNASRELDRCEYNNMVDNPRDARYQPTFEVGDVP